MNPISSKLLSLFHFCDYNYTKTVLNRELKKRRKPYLGRHKSLLYAAASCLPFHISGYTSRTHEILKSLRAAGWEALAATRPGYPWDRRDSLAGTHSAWEETDGIVYNHFARPTRWRHAAHYARSAAETLSDFAVRNHVGRIHAASNHMNALPALLAARSLGLPFQYEIRGLWELTKAARTPSFRDSPAFQMGLALERFTAENADAVFVISKQLCEYIIKNWNIDRKRVKLLPNCADIDRIKPFDDIEPEPGLIGYAGSMISYEGLDILLEALAILRSKKRDAKLMLIGDGEARPELEILSKKLGVDDRVRFIGRLEPEAARGTLARASLVCLPRKDFEVCRLITPLKLVEAMAIGKPVICSDLPVFNDELGELAKGWTFKPGSARDLADKLDEKLFQKRDLALQGALSRKRVIRLRQWKRHIPAIMD